ADDVHARRRAEREQLTTLLGREHEHRVGEAEQQAGRELEQVATRAHEERRLASVELQDNRVVLAPKDRGDSNVAEDGSPIVRGGDDGEVKLNPAPGTTSRGDVLERAPNLAREALPVAPSAPWMGDHRAPQSAKFGDEKRRQLRDG